MLQFKVLLQVWHQLCFEPKSKIIISSQLSKLFSKILAISKNDFGLNPIFEFKSDSNLDLTKFDHWTKYQILEKLFEIQNFSYRILSFNFKNSDPSDFYQSKLQGACIHPFFPLWIYHCDKVNKIEETQHPYQPFLNMCFDCENCLGWMEARRELFMKKRLIHWVGKVNQFILPPWHYDWFDLKPITMKQNLDPETFNLLTKLEELKKPQKPKTIKPKLSSSKKPKLIKKKSLTEKKEQIPEDENSNSEPESVPDFNEEEYDELEKQYEGENIEEEQDEEDQDQDQEHEDLEMIPDEEDSSDFDDEEEEDSDSLQ